MDIRLRVLKENNKSRFDSYKVRNSILIISHVTFRDCRLHIFSDILSRNSCMRVIFPIGYRKIPKISPGTYIFQRPYLRGLFLEGLMYGGKFTFQYRLG